MGHLHARLTRDELTALQAAATLYSFTIMGALQWQWQRGVCDASTPRLEDHLEHIRGAIQKVGSVHQEGGDGLG